MGASQVDVERQQQTNVDLVWMMMRSKCTVELFLGVEARQTISQVWEQPYLATKFAQQTQNILWKDDCKDCIR